MHTGRTCPATSKLTDAVGADLAGAGGPKMVPNAAAAAESTRTDQASLCHRLTRIVRLEWASSRSLARCVCRGVVVDVADIRSGCRDPDAVAVLDPARLVRRAVTAPAR
jgi:hypothetical protein